MTGPVEERLRRALSQQAETTTTAPEAWSRIRSRTEVRPRRSRLTSSVVMLPACAVAVVVVVAAAVLLREDGGTRVQVTGQPERLYLAPTGLGERFRLVFADTDPVGGLRGPSGVMRVFGRRAADGVALSASVVVRVPWDLPLEATDPGAQTVRVLNEDMTVHRDSDGRRIITWRQQDGSEAGLATFGLSDDELVAAATSLRAAPATAAPQLPPDFVNVFSGDLPYGPFPLTDQRWQATNGDTFSITVVEVPGVNLDALVGDSPGGRAVTVRGRTGLTDSAGEMLAWIERPNTLVVVVSSSLDGAAIREIAESLRPIDEGAWGKLAATAETDDPTAGNALPPGPEQPGESILVGPPTRVVPDSFFAIRPILGRSDPPCPAGSPTVLAEVREGQETACYEVGLPGLGAGDVTNARALPERTPGTWAVEFTLSDPGLAGFNALARMVGVGGQVAVVVDGRLVNAPHLASPSLPAKGVITGLDEQFARTLADRLDK
ncbi:MAG: hypothetical protein ABR540_07970 [Acidimicrobiales bacterium]